MKIMKKTIALILVLTMCFSTMAMAVQAEETAAAAADPVISVKLTPGGESTGQGSVPGEQKTTIYNVTATTSAVEVTTKQTPGKLTAVQSALKFDRNSTADQKAQNVARELYTDNGHFHDPSTITVTGAPEGYPFKYVGFGDYSGHYVSHVKVVYARDEAGNALKDADGNYMIDHLEHAGSGTPLHYGTELTTNIDGPYHYATGTRSQQFLLMDEAGNTYYGYCIDLATGAESSSWYALANLEDNDYYATQEAEDHVRGIVFNGYWGTESGTGSLASLKEALKEAVANGSVEDEYNIKMVNRKKFTTGYELQEGEYHYGSYYYWDLDPVDVKLTDEIIDRMTEGEALDAMQAAIWSYANGSQATLNGIDGVVVGDMSVASSAMSDSLNGKNDPEGAARTRALYAWLMQQTVDADAEKTVIINDKTFVEDMTLTIGKKLSDDAFAAKLSFSNRFTVDQNKDDLKIVLTYVDANGETQTIEKPLTGEGALVAENGVYTIDGLTLNSKNPFRFTLNIAGEQYLTKNAYIFTSEKGTNGSQTMVSMAEGTVTVDVSKSVEIEFKVETTVEYTPDIVINKVDEKGEALTGAKFELYAVAEGTEKLVGKFEVDTNGQISVKKLPLGIYKLVETEAPDGYIGASRPMYFELVLAEDGETIVAKPVESELKFEATAYEISNHITSVAIPQTFVLLNAAEVASWEYSAEYTFGESDYDVVYCGDSNVGAVGKTRYVKADLDQAFDTETAGKLRAIIANSYPYVSMEDMIAAAAKAGVADAENLTRGDLIAAVQLAVWHYTNGIEDYTYKATYSVMDYPRWGKVYNDYSDELPESLPKDTTQKVEDAASDTRIRALYNYLLSLKPVAAADCGMAVSFYTAVGGKDVSQSLIGGSQSDFYTNGLEIYVKNFAEPKIVPPTITFKNGEASNISFMLLDPKTNEVEFLKKIDIGSETSFEIPVAEGKISAVFVKQSTSGMFWFSDDVDEDGQNAVIECLKDHNPSYKGHNAVAFGAGDHVLEFKKNKFVTYTFTGKTVVTDGETVDVPATEEAEDEVVEETLPEDTSNNKNNNGNGNNKNKNKKNK